jgi:aldehyde dehydrogenase (NAD+)
LAFRGWAALPAPQRAEFFFRAAAALEARVERIAQDMTAEMGKPLREARMEAARAAAILRYSAGEAFRPAGEVYEPSVANQTLYTRRRPLGVVGLITPWNFPIAIPVWKLAPALIYGNSVVLKLGYEAPRTGLHLAECFAEAGLPPGVLNVLTGSGSKAGAELVSNLAVRGISFTGSVAVGHAVRNEATARDCRVQLELGGQNPLIVMPDAELDRAVEAAFAGAFWSAGQKCTASRRLIVHESVYDAFREKLLARVAAAKIGDPSDPATEVGPVVNEGPLEEILAAIERGKAEGGTVAAGGGRADDEGYLIAPTVFENVADDAFLACEEVFGPVTSLYRFSTLDEALERANAVTFGLSAAIFTRDLHTTQRFANELQAGILHVNSQTAGADVHVPFGGLKGSAWGPHEQGRAAMEFYTETVTVYQDAPLA